MQATLEGQIEARNCGDKAYYSKHEKSKKAYKKLRPVKYTCIGRPDNHKS